MKNLIAGMLSVVVAILVSSMFMGVSSEEKDIPVVASNRDTIKVFQIGAYKDQELANNMTSKMGGKVVIDNDYYCVYYAILSNSANIERMTNYLNNNHIYYYVKSINVDDAFFNELNKYEELMKETTTDLAFVELNKRLINLYGGNV